VGQEQAAAGEPHRAPGLEHQISGVDKAQVGIAPDVFCSTFEDERMGGGRVGPDP
jgi:hypothetical protein